jgi:hypothetical protein
MMLAVELATLTPCHAQTVSGFGSSIENYFINWPSRVTQIQSEQPQWIAPLVTVTPELLQQVRYDQLFESSRNGLATDNFGASRGIELIPFEDTEVIVGIPAFEKRNIPRNTNGFADWPFLVKLRLLSSNEERNDYIVTAFMGFTVPTGSNVNGNGHSLFTPTLAAGKGFGNFVVQSTVGVSFPSGGLDRLGMPLAWNTALQYRLFKYLWPEFETNYTWQSYGAATGQQMLYLTPGIVIGKIPIHDRVGLTFGAGYEAAVTYHRNYNHNVILSARIPF